MKYLLCNDVTHDKNNEIPNGQEFLTAELQQAQQDELERREKEAEKAERRGALPKWLDVVRYLLLVAGLIGAVGLFRAIADGVSPVQAYRNAPAVIWGTVLGLLIGGALTVYKKLQSKTAEKSEASVAAQSRLQSCRQSADACLRIPAEAERMDVLLFSYRMKNGAPEILDTAINLEMRLFREDGSLCVTDGIQKYALPLDALTGIDLWKHGIPIVFWNKNEKPNSKSFRNAGIMLQNDMPVGLRFCCRLNLQKDGQDYALAFPAYELPTVTKLTALPAPKLPPVTREEKKQAAKAAPAKSEAVRKDEKIRPEYYWRVPKDTDVKAFFSPMADIEFKAAHPKLYTLLMLIGVVALFAPMVVFLIVAITTVPDPNAWMLAGLLGSFVMGVGLFNLVAAWIHQYLGHIVTIVSIGAGLLITIISLLLL